MDLGRVRKAVAAGASTAVGSVWAALVNGDKPSTAEGWGALIGGAVALGVVAGIVTYRVRNVGPTIDPATGSDYPPSAGRETIRPVGRGYTGPRYERGQSDGRGGTV